MHAPKPAKFMSDSNAVTYKVKSPVDPMKPEEFLTCVLPFMTGFEYVKPVTKPEFRC